jgi:hypothetical protein
LSHPVDAKSASNNNTFDIRIGSRVIVQESWQIQVITSSSDERKAFYRIVAVAMIDKTLLNFAAELRRLADCPLYRRPLGPFNRREP